MTDARAKLAFVPRAYAVENAAACVGVSPRHFERAISAGDINVKWSGGKRIVTVKEIDAWLDSLPFDKPEKTA